MGQCYPSVEELEKLPVAPKVKNSFFGELEMQIGYCNGTNRKWSAVEHCRCSEFGVAASDLILFLGRCALQCRRQAKGSNEALEEEKGTRPEERLPAAQNKRLIDHAQADGIPSRKWAFSAQMRNWNKIKIKQEDFRDV